MLINKTETKCHFPDLRSPREKSQLLDTKRDAYEMKVRRSSSIAGSQNPEERSWEERGQDGETTWIEAGDRRLLVEAS